MLECYEGESDGFICCLSQERCLLESLNATFISLLPKVAGADDINKFTPIILVRSVYKILAKVLASRLSKVIGKVVGPYQHAFIADRQILDDAWIACECIDSSSNLIFPVLYVSSPSKRLMFMCPRTFLLLLREWAFLTN